MHVVLWQGLEALAVPRCNPYYCTDALLKGSTITGYKPHKPASLRVSDCLKEL